MKIKHLSLMLLAACLGMLVSARPLTEEEIQDVLANPENLTALLQGVNGETAAEMIGSLIVRIGQMPDPSARPAPPPPRRFLFFRRDPAVVPPSPGMSLPMQNYSVASYVTRAMNVLGPEESGIMMIRLYGNREIPDRLHAVAMASATLVAAAVTAEPATTQQGINLANTLREISSAPDTPEIIRNANTNPVATLGAQVVERLSRDFPVIQQGVTAFAAAQPQPAPAPAQPEADEPGPEEEAAPDAEPAPGDEPPATEDPAVPEEPVAPETPPETPPTTEPTPTAQQTTTPVQIVQPPPIDLDDEPAPTGPTAPVSPVIPPPYAGQS